MEVPLRVHTWPHCATDALAALQSEAGCAVISVATAHTENRAQARDSIRKALRDLLVAHWVVPTESIRFSTSADQALAVQSPASTVGLSISHAPGCSVAAVHLYCAVGIDVMRIDADPAVDGDAAAECLRLAHDYLGPTAHRQLLHTAPALRAAAFAHAWCELEAGLKCLGQGLSEWTPALGQALATCKVTALALPDSSLRGALALRWR